MAQINQYANEAVTLKGGDLFDVDKEITPGNFESQKVDWLTMVGQMQSQLTFANMGNSNLTATAAIRKYSLFGGTGGDSWGVYDTTGEQALLQVFGNNQVRTFVPTAVNGATIVTNAGLSTLGSDSGIISIGTNYGGKFTGNFGIDAQGVIGIQGVGTDKGILGTGNNSGVEGRPGQSGAYGVVATDNSVSGAFALLINGQTTFTDGSNMAFNELNGTTIATSVNQKFAFWDKTPIAQPTTAIAGATLVSNLGTPITDTDTFGGYTLQQLAAILINVGLAA